MFEPQESNLNNIWLMITKLDIFEPVKGLKMEIKS